MMWDSSPLMMSLTRFTSSKMLIRETMLNLPCGTLIETVLSSLMMSPRMMIQLPPTTMMLMLNLKALMDLMPPRKRRRRKSSKNLKKISPIGSALIKIR